MSGLLHDLLAASARSQPNATAVIDGDREISYLELEERSNGLAHLLVELGVEHGDRVGLYLDKSIESLIGLYGVMKAGAAYVPFDPQAPVARLAYIARDCGISILLTGREKTPKLAELLEGGAPISSFVVLNDDRTEAPGIDPARVVVRSRIQQQAGSPARVRVDEEDLAYILYTSGSTGNPKGVMLSHRAALAFVSWSVDEFSIGPDDRLSSHAPLHFDLSIFDLFAAAQAGASVVLVPGEDAMFPAGMARFIDRHRITVWYSVPSALTMLTLRGGLEAGAFPSLRTVLFAGEVFPTKHLRRLMELVPHSRFYNLFGPTETNVCTFYAVPALDSLDDAPLPIGVAIKGDDVFAMGEDGTLVDRGEVGELCVRGATVMHGYWGAPEKTDAVLMEDVFFRSGDRVYRTGDLVRQDHDGNWLFIGRRDSQIKTRGYRVELGEIEVALSAQPSVIECAVVPVPDELVTNRITAFVTARDDIDEQSLQRACARRLPKYMVPEAIFIRRALPKTSTGKIDRQALLQEATA